MSTKFIDISEAKEQLSTEKIKEKIHSECENIIEYCTLEQEGITFLEFEKELWKLWLPAQSGTLYYKNVSS